MEQQRFSLVRMYLYLAGVASLFAIAAGVLNGVAYFAFVVSLTPPLSPRNFIVLNKIIQQEDLMYECVSLATEGRAWEKAIFVSLIHHRKIRAKDLT